jgi:acyl-CoA hydrolase
VDGLQFLHPIRVGDMINLQATVTAAYKTSLEVEVKVFSEETLTGVRRMTSLAYLTFVTTTAGGQRAEIPGLILETPEQKLKAAEADARRGARIAAKMQLKAAAGELG